MTKVLEEVSHIEGDNCIEYHDYLLLERLLRSGFDFMQKLFEL